MKKTTKGKVAGSEPAPRNAYQLEKVASGIEGFDDITGGGLPLGRTTLFMGGPGCGKTVLALQILVSGASLRAVPGIFVAFEEDARVVAHNASTFGWDVEKLKRRKLVFFVNGCMRSNMVKGGAFDLTGLLAALEAKASEMGAKIVVFDAIDVLLSLLEDPAAEARELYRLREWLDRHELTGIITTKMEDRTTTQRYGFMPFMADCVVELNHRVADRAALRTVRILKYRGSAHVLSEVPFTIGARGLEVGSSNGVHPEKQPFKERVSTGVESLDAMLRGGLYRGTNALITGSSGTGKTMLAGTFIEAACQRGENALLISFDENSCDIVRDLASVSVDLESGSGSGLLRMVALRTESASSEEHFMCMKRHIAEHKPRCVAIDPISALARVGGGPAARSVAERLVYLCRNAGITLLLTSLQEGTDPHLETTSIHVSTIADTWIELSYSLLDGERNRALSVIKSRGSKHSNQMRELIFSDEGITLAEPYTGGGQVLMGALRVEKENGYRAETSRKRHEIELKWRELEQMVKARDHQIDSAERDLKERCEELETLTRAEKTSAVESTQRQDNVVRKRDRAAVQKQVPGLTRP